MLDIIKNDEYMMKVLRSAALLDLPDWWISAGFIRNKVWDVLHNFDRTPLNDIDVIYFEPINPSIEMELFYNDQLSNIDPNILWSVKNQSRMHLKNNMNAYWCSTDAVNKYPETPTAICVTLRNDKIILHYNYSFDELVKGIVKPTPYYDKDTDKHHIYLERIRQKDWLNVWPKLKIER
ncbi:nucleotidyltransferase family protein [Macrococcus animalis]|uniref:nucleotidyltransferase family protein n=1 Tax=Macrococcus animalis TaxID=3395467 RepID=UPI0039BE94FC